VRKLTEMEPTSKHPAGENTDELKATLENLERIKRSKSDLLANISHEIRTPMNAILTMSTLLKRSDPRPDQKEYCDSIDQSARALLRIIENMLELSRAEAGKFSLEIEIFELAKIVREVEEMIRPIVPPAVSFKVSVDSALSKYFKGDAGKIQQVLLNLLSNAARFTDFGEIELRVFPISTSGENVRLCFEVTDSGVGIPEVAFEKLFIPFSQVSPQSTKEKMGTGLGLAISRRFVEGMGGMIGVKSRFGMGSSFSFEVPLQNADRNETDLAESATIGELAFNGKVLVVDDNPSNIRVTKALLESMGLEVQSAEGGFEAIDKIETSNYDVVFMDCQMPDLDGFQTARRIRAREANGPRRVPIVALTAFVAKEVSERCEAYGMDDFLAKPIDFDQLSAVIGRFLTPTANLLESTTESIEKEPILRSAIVDFDALRRLRKLNPPRGEFDSSEDVIDELIRLYEKSVAKFWTRIDSVKKSGSPRELAECAHFLKSSSMSVGAIRVTDELQRLEQNRNAAALPADLEDSLQRLKRECEAAQREIKAWWREAKTEKFVDTSTPR
jgi:CheY-like chemotaxis protein